MRGLSARRLQRTTYSLGSRGTDDLGELDRRTVLVTAGTDVGEHALYTEFVAWGIDPKTGGRPDVGADDIGLSAARRMTRLRTRNSGAPGSGWLTEAFGATPGYDGAHIPAQRVLIDSGYRPEIVRGWCEAKYGQQIHKAGRRDTRTLRRAHPTAQVEVARDRRTSG